MTDIKPFLQFYQITDAPRLPDTGANVVHFWASSDNIDNLQKCAKETGENSLLVTDWYGNSALHYAAACSSYKCAFLIVKTFPKQHFYNQAEITPAHIAAQRGDVKMLQILCDNEYLMKDVSSCNWTPLHFAVIYKNTEAVKLIIDKCGPSMLHILTTSSDPVLSTYQPQDFKFFSALDIAKSVNAIEVVKLLLEYGALPSLHSAVLNKDNRALAFFLLSPHSSYRGKLDYVAEYRKCTALHLAASHDYYEICHSLLMSGATANTLDVDGYSALDVAIISDAKRAVSIIAPRCIPKLISSAFCLAADLKSDWAFSELISLRVTFDPNYADSNGESFLIHIIKRGKREFVTNIIKSGANTRAVDNYGATALHYAACSTYPEICNQMLDMSQCVDGAGLTPFGYSTRSGDKNCAPLLKNIEQNKPDQFGMTPALYGLFNTLANDPSLFSADPFNFKFRINVKALVDYLKKQRTDSEKTVFDYVSAETKVVKCPILNIYCKEILNNFINARHVDIFLARTDGFLKNCTILSVGVLLCPNVKFFDLIVKKYKQHLELEDDEKRTPLMLAVMCRRQLVVYRLLDNGASLACRDLELNTIWHYVDDVAVFAEIAKVHAAVQITPADVNSKGENPLHIACKKGNVDILKKLVSILEDGSSTSLLNATDKEGNTPLDNSLLSNSNDCIEFLHAQGVENRLISAISNKVNNYSLADIQNLISHGYPVNSSDRQKNTPLHAAVQNQRIDIINYLIAIGADVNALNSNSQTPLHIATEIGNFEIVKNILRRKVDVTAFPLENQPFAFAKDEKIRSFLYHYWKRQYYGHRLIDFVINCQTSLILLDGFGSMTAREVGPQFEKEFKSIITKIVFVSKKIIAMKPTNPKPFNFMTSLHHLLLLLTTIDMRNYLNVLQFSMNINIASGTSGGGGNVGASGNSGNINSINSNNNSGNIGAGVNSGSAISGGAGGLHDNSSTDKFFLFLFPLRWMKYILHYVKCLQDHLLPDVDDEAIFKNKIMKFILGQTQENKKTIKLIDDIIKASLPEVQRVANSARTVSIATTGVVEEMSCEPTYLFFPQFYSGLKKFFSKDFSIPRYIPFLNGSEIRITFVGKQVIFCSLRGDVFTFPIELVHFKAVKTGFQVWTPVGSFKILPPAGSPLPQAMLLVALTFIQEKVLGYDVGESVLEKGHSGTYQCLAAYQLGGSRTVDLRMLVVKADRPNQCYDHVQAHILESIPSNLIFLRVIPRKCESNDKGIVFV